MPVIGSYDVFRIHGEAMAFLVSISNLVKESGVRSLEVQARRQAERRSGQYKNTIHSQRQFRPGDSPIAEAVETANVLLPDLLVKHYYVRALDSLVLHSSRIFR